ncbi:unnamed protein product [Thelazia callipaeda]|uniref:Cystatin domain-containing protein n=1 Tax=Thelazia callipaeda TaxID=103827 RepID=A0A0N5CS16_THECL|nr:unnamed protein product [Thelazia callipaeda]
MLPSIMSKVNQQSNDAYHLMPIKVLEVQSQVVAGIKYKMRLQVARSQCKKGSNDVIDLKNCIKLEGAPDQIIFKLIKYGYDFFSSMSHISVKINTVVLAVLYDFLHIPEYNINVLFIFCFH